MYLDVCILIIFICADMKSPQPKKFLAVERSKISTAKNIFWVLKLEIPEWLWNWYGLVLYK